MTSKQERLVSELRIHMMRTGYQPIYIVDNETLEACEEHIRMHLALINESPILKCGKNGLLFKGCELVLKVENG
jgi:hypothetical protein